MNHEEVALGVECALPARFDAIARRDRRRSSFVWLLLGVAALAIL
jgi:hypothetical protein